MVDSPDTPPRVPSARPGGDDARPVNYACGFCECTNTRRGEVLSMSNKARGFRDQQDEIDRLGRELTTARTEISNLTAKVEQAGEELAAARKGQRFSLLQGSGRV